MARGGADWITLAEASEILAASHVAVTAETIGRWARTGKLSSIKPGGRRYVRRGEIRSLLRPRAATPSEDGQGVLFEEI
jgi:hypothetical protein